MGYVLINESILSSIGNILRSKLNTNISYPTSMMYNEISKINATHIDIIKNDPDIPIYSSVSSITDLNPLYKKMVQPLNLTLTISGSIPDAYHSSWFDDFVNNLNLSIPNCTAIGNDAFRYCDCISSIDLPNCNYIGSSAFYSCGGLHNISAPNCSYIGHEAFADCGLYNISIPNCSYIDSRAFYNCNLTNTCVQNILDTYISYSTTCPNAFNFCTNIKSLNLTSYISISNYAFEGCDSLSSINISSCYIGNGAFYGCYDLRHINLYDCTYIGDYAFHGCDNLAISSDLPNCSYIGSYAFAYANMWGLSADNCTYIGDYAFENCSNLYSISIPNCTYIGNYAFDDCTSLSSVIILSTSVPSTGVNIFNNTPFDDDYTPDQEEGYYDDYGNYIEPDPIIGSIYVLPSMVNTFKASPYWSEYASKITSYIENMFSTEEE